MLFFNPTSPPGPMTAIITPYDAVLPAFGKTQSDDALMLAFTLLNRRFDFMRQCLVWMAPALQGLI